MESTPIFKFQAMRFRRLGCLPDCRHIPMEAPFQDIKPHTPIASVPREFSKEELMAQFPLQTVAPLVGMSPTFIRKVLGTRGAITLTDVLCLLDQDAYAETFVPRSRVPGYLLRTLASAPERGLDLSEPHELVAGDARELIRRLPEASVQCVVTSTPYWALRLYDTHFAVEWADGEVCPFGHEQTPEGFIRHTVEILYLLRRVLTDDASVWWNLMDTYNTRTQIRGSAVETLRAMQGEDDRGWHDYACRRYSSGHAYLDDGELCLIPSRVAERASRIGYWVKSQITWKKEVSLPETVSTRVTREGEYILHLSTQRSPYFDKEAFRTLPRKLGGRNERYESDKITDVWCLPTANGTDGHGAQFPLALPGRCIGLSTEVGDLVLDPFVGSGTTSLAAAALGRRSIGFDVDSTYLETARQRLDRLASAPSLYGSKNGVYQGPLSLVREV